MKNKTENKALYLPRRAAKRGWVVQNRVKDKSSKNALKTHFKSIFKKELFL